MNKKAFYFTFDALIGIIILVGGAIIINYAFFSKPIAEPALTVADDVASLFEKTQIKDLKIERVTVYSSDLARLLSNDVKITDKEKTMMQQIGIFYYLHSLSSLPSNSPYLVDAKTLAKEFAKGIIPGQYHYSIKIQDIVLDSNPTGNLLEDQKKAKAIVTSKKIIYTSYMKDNFDYETVGPYTFEVTVWY